MRLSDLIGRDMQTIGADDPSGQLNDVLVDLVEPRLLRASFDLSGWAVPRHALVRFDNMPMMDGVIRLDLSLQELEALQESEPAPADGPADLRAMPPIIIGPFGHVASPSMVAAIYNAAATEAPRPDIDDPENGLHWFGHLEGLPVFDETGDVGELQDIIFDPETFVCQSIETRDTDGNLALFPCRAIRTVTRDEQSLILDNRHPPVYSAEAILNDMREK